MSEELALALQVTAIVLIAWLTTRALKRVIARLEHLGHLAPTMAARVQGLRRYTVLTIASLAVLQATGLFLYAWALVSAVIAAVAIGFFAAWSLLSNVTSAALILSLRPFRIGDHVELVDPSNSTAVGGEIHDMNLMYTTLIERDENGGSSVLHVPNNLFLQKYVRRRGAERGARESFFDTLTD